MVEIDLKDDATLAPQAGEERSSAPVLAALKKAEDEFREWRAVCLTIDEVYGKEGGYGGGARMVDSYDWHDSKLDMFWASFEVLKPAVYAKPPVPAVAPLFKDNDRLVDTTAELLERVATATLVQNDIDAVMKALRDDLIFDGRGVPWLRYDTDGGQKVCVEHLDRDDFRHEPARYWPEVGWAARRAWMTLAEMRKRFEPTSGDAYERAKFETRRSEQEGEKRQFSRKAGVWEVWHKADNKVYWVTDGVDVLLDESAPYLDLRGFFPCPRPAYATLRRRSLVPVPDWERYALHFRKISDLTGRIYLLLDQVKMKGLVPGGGEIGDAVQQMLASDDDSLIVAVPGAALMAGGGGLANFVQWMPLKELAEAIQGLIAARQQLIEDFYQLSGISDIMRGATEADETLGAQRLKSQYGSVRVRCKIDELQRVAADIVRLAAEIVAEKFSQKTLLEMSRMALKTRSEIEKRIKEVEKAADAELKALGKKAREAAQQAQASTGQQQADPQAASQQFEQAQQQILAKYEPMLKEAEQQVAIDDVMKLLRDDRVRSFTFEIESDSTILTDEMQEKASRAEFLTAFNATSQGLMQIAMMGEEGAEFAGQMLKFALGPYRAGRQMEGAIDKFVDAAPRLAAQMQSQQGGEADQALAQANLQIAQAEAQKAQAAVAKVQADSAKAQMDMQLRQREADTAAQEGQQRFALEIEQTRGNLAEQAKRTEKIEADIQLAFAKLGIEQHREDREDVKTASDIQMRRSDQAMAAEDRQRAAFESDRDAEMGARQQDFTERQGERAEGRADRQQTFAEKQAQTERSL